MAHLTMGNSESLSILASSQTGVSDEDGRILRGLKAGIDSAYEELIDKYEGPVYNVVYRLLGNQTDACDVVQEVFLKIFRGVNAFREQSSLRTWIYRIAVNEAHNHRRWFLRHGRHEVSIERENTEHEHYEVAQDTGPSPYELARGNETRSLIELALTRINPTFGTAVILRDIHDLSYEEIAEILQISLGTVKSRILRGREALRRELTQTKGGELAEALA